MKRKIIIFTIILCMIFNTSFATINLYTLTDEYNFSTNGSVPKGAYIEVFIGNINASSYQTGKTTITPKPTRYITDDYGNKIARFDITNATNQNFKVVITKEMETQEYNIPISNAKVSYDVENIYLQPSENVQSDNIIIKNKAEEITKGLTDDYSKMKKIFEFTNMYITYDTAERYRNQGALSALQTGRGVCEEYATLFVALCRASNIPARVISGYNTDDMKIGSSLDPASMYHAWPEVHLEGYGWVPLEVTAEYTLNGVKSAYWDGFLKLKEPAYVVEGVYKENTNELRWLGLSLGEYSKNLKFVGKLIFRDINNHWAKANIESLYNKKLVNGYEDLTFLPNNNVSRIEYIVFLSRTVKYLNGVPSTTNNIYYHPDFVQNWAKTEYDTLMRYMATYSEYSQDNTRFGAGYSRMTYVFGDKLDMNKPITREEVVALMEPFMVKVNQTEEVNFTDISDSKFKSAIVKSYYNEIIKGYPDGTFNPKGNITRAEIATVLDRCTNEELR